jgi:hypothetical protein
LTETSACDKYLHAPLTKCDPFNSFSDEFFYILKYHFIIQLIYLTVPESCADLVTCPGICIDGEYWLYPKATNGKRIKVYCHNMGQNPTEYITLKYTNTLVKHDASNWILNMQECHATIKPPLKSANFSKVAINIQVIYQYDFYNVYFISL